MNTLALLILEHLKKAGTNAVPDGTLFIALRNMTRPVASEQEWATAIKHLVRRGFIDYEVSPLNDEKKWFIKEAGLVALRQA